MIPNAGPGACGNGRPAPERVAGDLHDARAAARTTCAGGRL